MTISNFCCTCFSMDDLGKQVSVHPFIHPSISSSLCQHLPWISCERNSSYRSFWNFACVFFMVWRCACGLDLIVRLFFVTFSTLWTESFFISIYRQWIPLVSTTPLTVLYWLLWSFAYIFFMVWGCACSLGINVRTFFFHFFHCELSHFSPSIYRQWVPLVSATPLTVLYWLLWNFACIFFMVWGCAYGLDVIVRFFIFFSLFSILWT